MADFLNVITAQRALLQAEQELSDSTTAVLLHLVQLYRALGGGWESDTTLLDVPARVVPPAPRG